MPIISLFFGTSDSLTATERDNVPVPAWHHDELKTRQAARYAGLTTTTRTPSISAKSLPLKVSRR